MIDPKPRKLEFRIFISYRRKGASATAGRIYDALKDRYKAAVFMDIDGIRPGAEFPKTLESALDRSSVLLAIIGPDWFGEVSPQGPRRLDDPNDFVRREIERALARRITIIPLLIGGASMPSKNQLPDSLQTLADRHALELSTNRWSSDMGVLLKELDQLYRSTPGHRWQRARRPKPFAIAVSSGIAAVIAITGILFNLTTQPQAQLPSQTGPGTASLLADPNITSLGDAFTVKGANFPKFSDIELYYVYNQDSPQHKNQAPIHFGSYHADANGSFQGTSRALSAADCDSDPVLIYAVLSKDPDGNPEAHTEIALCPPA